MIKITRGVTYTDMIRVYKIFIDDVYRGDIKINETKKFTVDSGNHVVCAKIDWCRSNNLNFVSDGSVLELEVGSSLAIGKVFIPFAMFIYITFLKNKYLWIKKKIDNA